MHGSYFKSMHFFKLRTHIPPLAKGVHAVRLALKLTERLRGKCFSRQPNGALRNAWL